MCHRRGESDTVISYGDLLFRSYVLRDLVESEADFAVVVDSSPTGENNRTVRDFAYCSRRDDRGLFATPVLLKGVFGAAKSEPPARMTDDPAHPQALRTAAGSGC